MQALTLAVPAQCENQLAWNGAYIGVDPCRKIFRYILTLDREKHPIVQVTSGTSNGSHLFLRFRHLP